jgi:hypothetical protein
MAASDATLKVSTAARVRLTDIAIIVIADDDIMPKRM